MSFRTVSEISIGIS